MEGGHFPSLEGLLQSLSPLQAPSSVHSRGFLSRAKDWVQSSARQSGLSPHPLRAQLSWGTLRTQAWAHPRVLTQVRVLVPLRACPSPPPPPVPGFLGEGGEGQARGASGRRLGRVPRSLSAAGSQPDFSHAVWFLMGAGKAGEGAGGGGRQLDTEGLLVALHECGWEVGSCSARVPCRSQQRDRPPPAPSPAPLPSLSLPWTVCLWSGGLAEACSQPALLKGHLSPGLPVSAGFGTWRGQTAVRSRPRDSSCAQNLGQ